jgi:hypothetical protein
MNVKADTKWIINKHKNNTIRELSLNGKLEGVSVVLSKNEPLMILRLWKTKMRNNITVF